MNNQEFKEILLMGREQRHIEFKTGGSKTDKRLLTKVIRAAISMANNSDGGKVIIGISENDDGSLNPDGITEGDLATWSYDKISDSLAEYCEPNIIFDYEVFEYESNNFIILNVSDFDEVPILCKKDYPEVLRSGACYVRTRRKPETSEIPTYIDMRDLIDLAVEKSMRKFIKRANNSGILLSNHVQLTDDDLYASQLDYLRDVDE